MREGNKVEADKLLENEQLKLMTGMDTTQRTGGNMEYFMACICAIKGDKKAACNWFQKAIERGYVEYQLALRDPFLENIRSESQFKKTIEQVKAELERMKNIVDAAED